MKSSILPVFPQRDPVLWNQFLRCLQVNNGNDHLCGPDFVPLEHEFHYSQNLSNKIEKGSLIVFSEVRQGDSEPVFVGFDNLDVVRKRAQFFYAMSEKSLGSKEYISAFTGAIKYGFVNLDLRRITTFVAGNSLNVQTTFNSFGFKKEGVLREYLGSAKSFDDLVVYGILRSECLLNFEV